VSPPSHPPTALARSPAHSSVLSAEQSLPTVLTDSPPLFHPAVTVGEKPYGNHQLGSSCPIMAFTRPGSASALPSFSEALGIAVPNALIAAIFPGPAWSADDVLSAFRKAPQ
jgi:hypothetical protein